VGRAQHEIAIQALSRGTHTMAFSNVVFFQFSRFDFIGFYITPMAIVVVLIEGGILRSFNLISPPWRDCFLCSMWMNLISAVLGFFLPYRMGFGWHSMLKYTMKNDIPNHGQGYDWFLLLLIAFFQAWLLSVMLELLAVIPFKKVFGFQRIVLPVIVGNLLSYIFLLGCYIFFAR
jgi:hypothetical protein